MKTNLNKELLDKIEVSAKGIKEWLSERNTPEFYKDVNDLTLVRDFLNTLDLLETLLIKFTINVYLTKLALKELENPEINTIGWEFWQIDIEYNFAFIFLELCNQLSNVWKSIESFAKKEKNFNLLRIKYRKPGNIILARHKTTHFQPDQFQNHPVSNNYSILRRPYEIKEGEVVKELAKDTMTKVASLVSDSIKEGLNYLESFKKATIGKYN